MFDDLITWLQSELPKLSGKSDLAKAIRYALTRLPRLKIYLSNGHLEIDNNTAERGMRGLAIGVKTGCLQAPRAEYITLPSYTR